jgi:hypothetical protein
MAEKGRKMQHDQLLIRAIRQHCAARNWFGVDLRGPEWDTSVVEDDRRKTGFIFPPATKNQLWETEALLGFSLPPTLRSLYTEIANGGFGPAYGIRGAVGGFADATGTVVEHYQGRTESRSLLDLDLEAELAQGEGEVVVPFDQWPRMLISICEWGCAIQICLDCITGRVFRVEPSRMGYHITREAASLEEWLKKWMRDELYSQPEHLQEV